MGCYVSAIIEFLAFQDVEELKPLSVIWRRHGCAGPR
jgi:hypothetical protein